MRALRPDGSRIPTSILEYSLLLFGDAESARPQHPYRRKTPRCRLAAVILQRADAGSARVALSRDTFRASMPLAYLDRGSASLMTWSRESAAMIHHILNLSF
jgi:hypothetical protein